MAEVKWIKITTDMFNNRKIKYLRTLPDGNSIILIWVMLLTMAGRCNAGGMIFLIENIPYTTKMLADELDFEESTVVLALKALQNLGMIFFDGDFFSITNWEEYQNVDGMEKIKEQTRARVAKHREKKKLEACNVTSNVTVTQSNATDIDIEEDKRIRNKKESIKKKPFEIPSELSDMWTAFVEHRKKLKKPMTDYTKDLSFKKLMKLSNGDIETANKILEQSIENGWQGLFELKGGESCGKFKQHSTITKKPTVFEYGETLG